ncbi:Zinc finger protein GLIS3 [Nymphon striatum]|nr:Zinc finger protein GLIS3 [Nymphon striatum]
MVCSPVESINRPLELSMLGRRDYRTPSKPKLLSPLQTPNKQMNNGSLSIDSSYGNPLFTQRMYDTEYDNLAIGRFMDPSAGSLFDQKNSTSSRTQNTFQNQNSNERFRHDQDCRYNLDSQHFSKDQLLKIPNRQTESFQEPNFSSFHGNYKLKLLEDSMETSILLETDLPVVEPICIKTDIYNLQSSCPPALCQPVPVDLEQSVHSQLLQPDANTVPKNDTFDDTLEDLLKEYIKSGPMKDRFQPSMPDDCNVDPQCRTNPLSQSKSSNSIPSNLNITPENSLGSCCDTFPEFLAPQQRAPKALSRSNSRESQALVKSDRSSNNGSAGNSCFTESVSFNINPSYSVTEWLQTGLRSGSGQSLSSQFSLTSITRGKKRALSNSPLSIDGIDLNTAIRTSPTSLVAFINGSPSNSLSPAFGAMNERGGYYGHLSARTSPFASRSSSLLLRNYGSSPGTKHRDEDRIMASVQSFERQPAVHPEEANTLQNQSIRTLQTNLNMLDHHAASNLKYEHLSSCMYSRTPPVLKAVKPPPSYHQHMLQERYQHTSKYKDTLETETLLEKTVPLACKWLDCKHNYADQQQLVKHIEKVHVDQKKGDEFTCLWDECPRRYRPFNARYKLLIHMRVHSGEKPNKCMYEGCSKAFSRLENLKIHERSHTGEKPYTCQHPGCTKRFSNSSDRAKHQRTHLDTKPYACQVPGCGKKYTDPSSLRKHSKSHQKDNQNKKKDKAPVIHGTSKPLKQYDVPTSMSIPSTNTSKQDILGRRLSPLIYPDLPLRDVTSNNIPPRNMYLPPLQEKLPAYHHMPVLPEFSNQYGVISSNYQSGQRQHTPNLTPNLTPIPRSSLPNNPLTSYNESHGFNKERYNERDHVSSRTNYSALYSEFQNYDPGTSGYHG